MDRYPELLAVSLVRPKLSDTMKTSDPLAMGRDFGVAEVLPNFLVVGAQRCGTTYLYHLLAQCSDIYLPAKKELHFLSRAMLDEGKSFDLYSSFFSSHAGQICIGEVTPDYIYVEDVPKLIRSHLGDIKLIFVLRDPIWRAHSHYWWAVSKRREYLSFEAALDAEPRRLKRDFWSQTNYSYTDKGFYHRQIERYATLFDRENMLFVISEDLYESPIDELTKICEFLDVSLPLDLETGVDRYKRKAPNHPALYRMLVYLAATHRPEGRGSLRRQLGKKLLRRVPMSLKPYPAMKPETRQRLQALFHTDVERLQNYLGRELCWLGRE